jgi:amino acid adenylation domain-containing protein
MSSAVESEQSGLPITRRAENTTGELSFAQERVWLHQQIEPSSITYNRPTHIRLKGVVDVTLLRVALDLVVERHESLRSSVDFVEGNPCQVVHEAAPLELPLLDLRGETAPEERARAHAQEEAVRPFDLRCGPLLRTRLLRLGEAEYLLVLTIHHFTFDAWSESVLLDEFSSHYGALSQGVEITKKPLLIQYADFAAWDRSVPRITELESGRSYWRAALIYPPILELRTDYPRPHELSEEAGFFEFELPDELLAHLRALTKREEATLFSLLLSAFFVLLHRYTDEEDMIVGCPVAGRTREELEPLIGSFINTLPLRAEIRAQDTFLSLLSRVKETVLKGIEHQEVPLQFMVQDVLSERDLSSSPLFQTMFIHERMPRERREAASIWFEPEDVPSPGTMVDLTMEILECKACVTGRLKYRQELWDTATIERMAGHFLTLLKALGADPVRCIGELPLLTETESHQILVEWNDTTVEYPNKCVHELFESQAERAPDAIALVFESEELTYRELNERANHLAHYLIEKEIGPEVLVAICIERSIEMIVGILGILKAGGAYVPLDPNSPDARLSFILEDCGKPLLVTTDELSIRFADVVDNIVLIDDRSSIPGQLIYNPSVSDDIHQLAYVIYTSGSTGLPKGVEIEHKNVTRLMLATEKWFHFGERDVWTLFHSSAFDFSVWEIWGALLYGGKLIVVPYIVSRSPKSFYRLIQDEGVTVLNQTPSAFQQLIQAEGSLGETALSLRYVIFGGEDLKMLSLRPWFNRHGDKQPQLVNMYGVTETTVHVTYHALSEDDLELGSIIGVPIQDLQVYLLDAQEQPVSIGVSGELYIGGAGLARGYLNRPELTAERFIEIEILGRTERVYRTGDLCRWRVDGNLEFLGRMDHQVKVRGFRIELGEIEAVLSAQPGIKDNLVLVREDTPGEKRLVAYVVLDQEDPANTAALRRALAEKLPDYMLPAAFISLDTLPLTTNGKLDWRALPVPELNRTAAGVAKYTAPSTPLEEALVAMWIEILGLDQVGIHDNFFDLGGHSLLAIRLMSKIQKELDLELPLRMLFESPTIELLGLAILDIELSAI